VDHGQVERTKVLVEREVCQISVDVEKKRIFIILGRLTVRHPIKFVYRKNNINQMEQLLTFDDFDRLSHDLRFGGRFNWTSLTLLCHALWQFNRTLHQIYF